jgi:hypothetical protein
MKKTLVIASLAVLSTSAFASKARMESLGQDSVRGSEYIMDSRNVFRNPAELNEMKNYIITEWGTGALNDAANAPRAEGGFFREMGAFNYGLYLGNNERALTGGPARVIAGTAGFLAQDNAVDLFLAGDMGVKWGARLHYANAKDESTAAFATKNSAFGLGLGATMGDAEVYADTTLSDKSTAGAAAGDEYKTKPSFLVGGAYKWSGVTFFANYNAAKADVKVGTVTTNYKESAITVGAGRVHEINPTARLLTDAKLVLAQDTNETAVGKTKSTTLPVTLGLEADATSWLVVRGNVHQNVIVGSTKNVAGKTTTKANSTTVDAGATLNFGKLKVDGNVGTTGTTGTASSKTGVLSTNNLLTRVAVSYWF